MFFLGSFQAKLSAFFSHLKKRSMFTDNLAFLMNGVNCR